MKELRTSASFCFFFSLMTRAERTRFTCQWLGIPGGPSLGFMLTLLTESPSERVGAVTSGTQLSVVCFSLEETLIRMKHRPRGFLLLVSSFQVYFNEEAMDSPCILS